MPSRAGVGLAVAVGAERNEPRRRGAAGGVTCLAASDVAKLRRRGARGRVRCRPAAPCIRDGNRFGSVEYF